MSPALSSFAKECIKASSDIPHAALGHAGNSATEQRKQRHKPQDWKRAAGNGGIGRPVLGGVLQSHSCTINHFDPTALKRLSAFRTQPIGRASCGIQSGSELIQPEAGFGPAIGAVVRRKLPAIFQFIEGLKLADHFPTRCQRVERLPEHAPEGAKAGVIAVATVLFGAGFGKELGRYPGSKAGFDLAKSQVPVGTERLSRTRAHGIEAVGPGREERSCVHTGGISTALLTSLLHFSS